jgi:signal transduction histidine kinase
VLAGTYSLVGAVGGLLWVSFALGHNLRAFGRLMVCCVALLYIAAAHVLSRLGRYRAAAYLLVLFYTALATGIVWSWGVNTPIGTLVFALVIVLAGILLTARYALVAAAWSGLILMGVQVGVAFNWHRPDMSWTGRVSSFGDVLGYWVVFCMLALLSWLYNREMERSLARAGQAEAALLQQKATLEVAVKERTEQLRQAQLEEMRQMYRFAELGQLGATLLHDLANYLTALTLEIEGLQSPTHSKAIARVQRIIRYLENVVDSMRGRLRGNPQSETFNIIRKLGELVTFLRYKAAKAGVVMEWQQPAGSWKYTGDSASLLQVLAIIMGNAIDAYGVVPPNDHGAAERRVAVGMQRDETHIIITVRDWGCGITESQREHLFAPFHSTKESGLGLGLFIARQTVEANFSGTLELSPRTDLTEFIVKLPLKDGQS